MDLEVQGENKVNKSELEKLTDEQLDEKITKLNRIIYSRNANLSIQAQALILVFKEEMQRRLSLALAEHYEDMGEDLDDVINIGSIK
jgi:hypothetical protein